MALHLNSSSNSFLHDITCGIAFSTTAHWQTHLLVHLLGDLLGVWWIRPLVDSSIQASCCSFLCMLICASTPVFLNASHNVKFLLLQEFNDCSNSHAQVIQTTHSMQSRPAARPALRYMCSYVWKEESRGSTMHTSPHDDYTPSIDLSHTAYTAGV